MHVVSGAIWQILTLVFLYLPDTFCFLDTTVAF